MGNLNSIVVYSCGTEHKYILCTFVQVSEGEVVALIQRLNSDPMVHAILLQLPLDSENHIDADKCTNTIAVYKVSTCQHIINNNIIVPERERERVGA